MQAQHGIAKLRPLQNIGLELQMPNSLAPKTTQLSATNLSCHRGDNQLFDDISFDVSAGECLHVTGPNGCGKTSLLRIVCGLNQAESGQVLWNGKSIAGNSRFYRESAYIAHKEGLKNELTAIENLRYYQQLDASRNEAILDNLLAKLGILPCADLLAQQLSFGQRRRLSFARLLVAQFPLWVLDEPFTGIDHSGRTLIESLCVEHLENGGSIIMTHHQSLRDSPLNQFRSELALGKA